MNRKELTETLRIREWTVSELAREFHVRVSEIVDDIGHIQKSLRHGKDTLFIDPAECRQCGFRFSEGKIGKPSKCPECRSNRIREPLLEIRSAA